MSLQTVSLGNLQVSRLAIGGNPFSAFSRQGDERDREMRRYYTVANIKDALHKAEAAGINTLFARTDHHLIRMLQEYWDEGGTIQWIAQTCAEWTDFAHPINLAGRNGAKGCYLHGGQTDYYFHQKQFDNFHRALDQMRSLGLTAGVAGHRPEAHEWVRDHLKPDFQMTSYYDPSIRAENPNHIARDDEKFDPLDRDAMARVIRTISVPVVHYKPVGGRTPPEEAFAYVAGACRPKDVVLVGFHLGDDPDLISKTVKVFERIVQGKVQ